MGNVRRDELWPEEEGHPFQDLAQVFEERDPTTWRPVVEVPGDVFASGRVDAWLEEHRHELPQHPFIVLPELAPRAHGRKTGLRA